MSYTIVLRPNARKAFHELPGDMHDRVEAALDALAENPRAGDTKKLQGRLRGLIRLRVGYYRVLYLVDEPSRTLDVLKIGPRGGFYD